jgi:hypothetical protein
MTRILLFMTMLGLALSTEAHAQSGTRGTNPQGAGGSQNIQPSLPGSEDGRARYRSCVLYVSGKVTVETELRPLNGLIRVTAKALSDRGLH